MKAWQYTVAMANALSLLQGADNDNESETVAELSLHALSDDTAARARLLSECVAAAVSVAKRFQEGTREVEPNWISAMKYYGVVLHTRTKPSLTQAQERIAIPMPPNAWKLHEQVGDMYAEGGHGLASDAIAARRHYDTAADLAEAAMKFKASMLLRAKAEELQ